MRTESTKVTFLPLSDGLRRVLPALALVLVLALLVFVSTAAAQGRPMSTVLTGAAEVSGGDPDGQGTASLTFNPGQGQVCFTLTASGIEPATAAHIHAGPAGVDGPVVVGLAPPTDGTSSGCVSADRDLIRAILVNPAGYYVNVHNAEYPGGALRGQLSR